MDFNQLAGPRGWTLSLLISQCCMCKFMIASVGIILTLRSAFRLFWRRKCYPLIESRGFFEQLRGYNAVPNSANNR